MEEHVEMRRDRLHRHVAIHHGCGGPERIRRAKLAQPPSTVAAKKSDVPVLHLCRSANDAVPSPYSRSFTGPGRSGNSASSPCAFAFFLRARRMPSGTISGKRKLISLMMSGKPSTERRSEFLS